MIVLRPCVTCHKFRLCSRFTRPFWPVRCRPAEGARRLPKRTAVAGRPLGVPYGIAYRRWERKRSQIAKNTRPTALCVGAVPAGSPCYEIWPYLFLYDGRFLRATNHEPLFFTSRGVPAAMSSICACRRVAAAEFEASGLRAVRPLTLIPKYAILYE